MTMSMDPMGDLGAEYLAQRAKANAEENDPAAWLKRKTAEMQAPKRQETFINMGGGGGLRDAPAGTGTDPSAPTRPGIIPAAEFEAIVTQGGPGPAVKQMGSIARDVAMGVVETAPAVLRGALDSAAQLSRTTGDLATWVNETIHSAKEPADLTKPEIELAKSLETVRDVLPEVNSNTGKVIESVAQWLTGGKIVGRLAKAAGVPTNTATRIIKDVAVGAGAFDPEAQRLSDIAQEIAPNALTEFLQAKEDDPVLEKRLKAGLEAAGVGKAAEGIIKAVKLLRASKRAKLAETAAQASERPAVSLSNDPAIKDRALAFLEGKTSDAPVQVNLERFQSAGDIRSAIAELSKGLPKTETMGMEQTLRQAEAMGLTPEALEQGLKGKIFDRRQISAGWMLFTSMASETQRLAIQARNTGAPEDLARYLAAWDLSYAVLRTVKGQSTEIARALQIHNAIRQRQPDMVKNFQAMLEQQGGADQALAMAERMAAMNDPDAVKAMIRLGGPPTTRDKIAYAYANVLLSNPASLAANVGDTSLATFLSVPETWVASKFGGDVLAGEASARLFGILWGMRDGFGMAARALKTGESAFGAGSRFEGKAVAATSRDLSAGEGRRIGDYLAMLVPTRLMMAGDELTKNMNYRAEMAQRAYREGGDAREIGKLLANPPEWLRSAAEEAAITGTFNQKLGPMMARLSAGIDKMDIPIPGTTASLPLGRTLFPFIRTPANLERWVLHRTPMGFLSPAVQEQLAQGGAVAELALARIATGSALASLMAGYVMAGQITGQGPKDGKLRAALERTGWQPYSIRFSKDGPWYGYGRSGTLGTLIGHVADATEMISGIYTRDPKAIDIDGEPVTDSIAAAVVLPFASAVKDKTFLQTASRLVDALSDPHAKGDRFLQGLAASTVPAVVGAAERSVDPELRRSQGYIEAIQSRIPGVSKSLPPQLNLWGEERRDENGLWNLFLPMRTSEQKGTAIDRELVRMHATISPPPQIQSFGRDNIQLSIKLSPEQHNTLIKLAGNELKLPNPFGGGNIGAHDLLDAIVEGKAGLGSRQYKAAGDERRQLFIRSILTKYREAAHLELLKREPELRDLVMEELQARGAKLRAPRQDAGQPTQTGQAPAIQ